MCLFALKPKHASGQLIVLLVTSGRVIFSSSVVVFSSLCKSCSSLFRRYWHEERHRESNRRRTSWYHLEVCYGEFTSSLVCSHMVHFGLNKKHKRTKIQTSSCVCFVCSTFLHVWRTTSVYVCGWMWVCWQSALITCCVIICLCLRCDVSENEDHRYRLWLQWKLTLKAAIKN